MSFPPPTQELQGIKDRPLITSNSMSMSTFAYLAHYYNMCLKSYHSESITKVSMVKRGESKNHLVKKSYFVMLVLRTSPRSMLHWGNANQGSLEAFLPLTLLDDANSR